MLLLNSLLTILVLEKVSSVVFAAVKPIIKTVDSSNLNANKDIFVKISPDTIYKSFRAVVSSDYLQNLAEDFAQKAAAHFMTIMKKSEDKTFRQDKFGTQTRPPTNTKANIIIPPVIKNKVKPFANKEELLVLLKEPAIDGDNLEQALSAEISETTEGKTARVKINGAYYKRHNQFDIQPISRPPNDTEANLTIPPGIEMKAKEEHLVKKNEVLVLLRDPAIKEDNLEQALTKEISETTEGKATRLQINGSTYYKKQDLVVSPDLTSTKEPKTTKMMEALTTSNTTTEKPTMTTQIRVPIK